MEQQTTSLLLMVLGSILFIIVSLIALIYSWTTLKKSMQTLPEGHRRIFFKLTGTVDKRIKNKLNDLSTLFMGSIFLGLNIACNIMTSYLVINTIVNPIASPFASQDLLVAMWSFRIGVMFLLLGFIGIGFAGLGSIIDVSRGRESALFYEPKTEGERKDYKAVFSTAIGLNASLDHERVKYWDNYTWVIFAVLITIIVGAATVLLPADILWWHRLLAYVLIIVISVLLIKFFSHYFYDFGQWFKNKFTRK